MLRVPSRAVVPAVVTLGLLVSLVAAQPTAALQTAVDGPGEVTKHDDIELVVAVTPGETDGDAVESYSLEITPAGEDDPVTITFTPDGTVLQVDPPRGVVGDGAIRVNLLQRGLTITPRAPATDTGYGYGDGYGYGYGDGEIATFDVVLSTTAFKHGTYAFRASVNTADERGLGTSDVETVTVLVPAGHEPLEDDQAQEHDAQRADDERRAAGATDDDRTGRGPPR